MLDLLWHGCFRWKLRPHQVTGDARYGTLENIMGIEAMGIRAYLPVPDFEQRTPFFGKQHFTYEAATDQYRCPQGAVLRLDHHSSTTQASFYQAEAATCQACPVKGQCTPSEQGRTLKRNFDEAYLDLVRSYHAASADAKAMRKRQVWVEPLCGEVTAWPQASRFRLRTLPKAHGEGILIAVGQTLKRLLQHRGWGRRPGPTSVPLAGHSVRPVTTQPVAA